MKLKVGGKKRKKKEEKDKNFQNNIIYPMKHDRIDNLNYFSEEIAKEIIDKIISLTFTKLYSKKIENKFPQFYLEHFINSTNNLIELCNINHDIDDMYLNINKEKKMTDTNVKKITSRQIKNNKEREDKNNNNESMDIIYDDKNDINKINKIQFSVKIINKNFWGNIIEPKSFAIDRTCNNKNNLIKEKKNKYNENTAKNIDDKINKKKSLSLFSLKKKLKNIIENTNIKKKVNIFDFPSENIPLEQFERQKETEEIKQLRKSFIEEKNKINMEKEMKKRKTRTSLKDTKNIKDLKKSNKKGNLQQIKEINPDTLIKEFNPVFSNQKEIKSGASLSNLYQEILRQENEASKNIEYNINYNKSKEIKKDAKKNKEKKVLKENKPNEITMRLKPSGSNFSIIQPSVGVNIKEEKNIKSGGINFYEKYKKFSIHDFNRTLQTKNEIMYVKSLSKNQNDIFNKTTAFSEISNIKERKDNKNDDDIILQPVLSEETNEDKFRKTFSNKLGVIKEKKKIINKSKSGISLTGNRININLKDFLASGENEEQYAYNNNNEHDINYYLDVSNNKDISNIFARRKIYSPIPSTNIKRYHNNAFLKKKIIYKVMDNFTRKIAKGEYKDKLFENDSENKKKGILLPKIHLKKNNTKTGLQMKFYRTKNYFYRDRKRKKDFDDFTNLNSNLL